MNVLGWCFVVLLEEHTGAFLLEALFGSHSKWLMRKMLLPAGERERQVGACVLEAPLLVFSNKTLLTGHTQLRGGLS